jgi:phosphoglycolate phosphatase
MSVPLDTVPKIRLLVFDLDGTLVDSKLDLALSVNAMRAQLGLEPLAHDIIATYVGHGVRNLMRRSLGEEATEETLQRALEIFLAHYGEHLLDHTVIYPGVREALEELQGRHLTVLTNKPVGFSQVILDGLGVAHYFRCVYGGNSFEQRKPHPVGVAKLMADLNVPSRETMIIGDSDTDVLTGRNAGVWTCGVTYGFGAHTLADAPPDFTIHDLRELPGLLDGCPKGARRE